MPAASTRRRRVGRDARRVRQLDAGPARRAPASTQRRRRRSCRDSCSEPPRSNHSTTCFRSRVGEDSPSKTLPTAARTRSRATLVGALQLALVLELELAGHRRQRGVDVGDARHDRRLAGRRARGARRSRRRSRARVIGSRWLTPERLSILRSLARLERDLLDHLAHERRAPRSAGRRASAQASCAVIAMASARRLRVVRADLGADAVLERRDDLAARRVVLGVGGEDHQHVERQPHRVALDLDVALLQDVEQADLDLAGQVGQLVDGEDAAVRPRQQPEVHRQLVAELQPALRAP